jgi:uncharacterized protein
MFVERIITNRLRELASKFPILSVTGPRQSGKTTLLRNQFPEYRYISLENPDTLEFAQTDTRRFLATYDRYVIIDEAQKVPQLFNYLQGKVDEDGIMGQYILSGSQNYLLMQNISQSLAGRTALFKLFPFSFAELKSQNLLSSNLEEAMFKGCYPRIYDRNIAPTDFYPNYFETYIQRDVRELKAVHDLVVFRNFVRLCAGRIGQPINYQSLAQDSGIAPTTVKSWLNILETSHIIFFLPPYFKNFAKRITKSPKIYFYDTGLVCSLLRVESPSQLISHHFRGNLFENLIVSEITKQHFNQDWASDLFYWQESNGKEIDLLRERSNSLTIAEIKSAATINSSFFDNLCYFQKINVETKTDSFLIYGGGESQSRTLAEVRDWQNIEGIL